MSTSEATAFKWFSTGDEAFSSAAEALRAGQGTIRLDVYTYTDSPIGRRVLEELIAAARRGVRVRVLVDAVGSFELPQSFWQPLTEAGGEARWFNPISLERFAIRNHRKLL